MLARTNNLAENAAVGTFPSVQVPVEPLLLKCVPQQRMAYAIAKGLWRPLLKENAVLNVLQLDDQLLISNAPKKTPPLSQVMGFEGFLNYLTG
jgi:hypothetical protein